MVSRLSQTAFVGWRALIPTTATLVIFILIILLISVIGGAVVPLATTSTGTVVESGAPHPLTSRLGDDYANVLRSQNLSASPEVLYAQTLDGDLYLIRGAKFTAFHSVSDARLVTGYAPQAPDQAVIGRSLATTLDIEVGDTITIGGRVVPGVRRVTIIGTFTGSGLTEHQLIVPVATAQELATGAGEMHLIRTNGTTQAFDEVTQSSDTIVVTDISGPSTAEAGSNYTVSLTARNLGSDRVTREITVRLGSDTQSVDVSIPETGTEQVDVTFTLPGPGTCTVSAAGVTRSVEVYDAQTLVLPPEYPDRPPPDATLIVPAATRNGTTIENATVTLGDSRAMTTSEGAAPIRVPPDPGEYQLTVEKDGYTDATHDLTVKEGAPQRLTGRLTVRPNTGNRLTNPTVEIQLANPLGTFLVRNVSLITPSTVEERTVEMTGGNVTRLTLSASEIGFDQRIPPGSYELRLVSNGTVLATTTYEVTGDDRVAATLASEGAYASGTGIGRAIENVFGNVQVLFLIITGLAGLSVGGGTTATFAYAVSTSKRTIGIYRATGARPRQILQLLF